MSAVLLCPVNRINAAGALLSNGSWQASLPLANLQDPNIDKAARSTNALTTSTIFAVDMGPTPYTIRAVALVNHNLSTAATWRVKGGTAAPSSSNVFTTGQVFDSGSMNVLQMTFNWDVPSSWGATYMAVYVFQAQTVRYVTVDIVDTSNAAGFVQIGRAFIGTAFQPAVNFEFGQGDAWNDFSTKVTSKSGKDFWNKISGRQRIVDFALPTLTGNEPAVVHEMENILGLTDEVLYVPDSADLAATQRYGMLGTLSQLTPLENPRFGARRKAFRIAQKM